ncbi:MAG: hypothetical protein EOP05_09680 [Proteobacteria bacterium]|nr:MAG: hypothetical protein EOP05_09680 [Pseudomonadota bacterium]
MKNITLLALTALTLTTLAGCAHHRDVRPGADGVHRVQVQSEDTEAGTRDAISQANNYCEEKKKEAVFIQEDKKYTGDLDEETYKTGKRIATVAKGVGAGVFVFGGNKERKAGTAAGIGGGIGDNVLGKGYTVDMKFKCQ